MPKSRNELLTSIANTIKDYREGEIPAPTADHVEEWVQQFAPGVQAPILSELSHVLGKSYVPRQKVLTFFSELLPYRDLAGPSPGAFWKSVNFLGIQKVGNSQRELLSLLNLPLGEQFGLTHAECGSTDGAFVYLDDAIFSGNRVGHDLAEWIRTSAPDGAKVYVITIAKHQLGEYYAKKCVSEAIEETKKRITVEWWWWVEIENRKKYNHQVDVLRPRSIPDDQPTRQYVEQLRYEPLLREGDHLGRGGFFASAVGRHLLEQEFLKVGVRIRERCPYLNRYQRPLGNSVLESLGFGSVIVTYRNCPNNCPLVFWAGDPWYPLFPRKTN
jgi:hypothetical protein